MAYRLGVDVGGTFTDLLLDQESGGFWRHKTPSTPHDSSVGILTGVFVKGHSPLFVGIDLAPHLPLEEVFFLLFLSYLAVVLWPVFERRQAKRDAGSPARVPTEESAS